jgi:UDP-N-acetylmuramate dehydrogenase
MAPGNTDFAREFFETVGKKVGQSVLLRKHANFRVGGPADYFFGASSLGEFLLALRIAKQQGIPFYVVGGGYNLLFDDDGFRGLIIKNCARGIEKKGTSAIEVLSGTPIWDVLGYCVENGMEGFEFLAGIPGTVGGAVCGNAGAFDRSIGSFLTEALVFDKKGEKLNVGRDYFLFNYRKSRLRTEKNLLLQATFSLRPGIRQQIEKTVAENLAKREKKHPPRNVACAGSYFKNPVLADGKRIPAAHLLDQVGAKNRRFGGATVFPGHANFIINDKNATSKDILSLASELKNLVKKKFGIELEEEVIYLPAELPGP